MAAKPPFPLPKCSEPGCEREGTGNLQHAGKPRLRSVKGTDGKEKKPIFPMACRSYNPFRHFHTAYLGEHGERTFALLNQNGEPIHGALWYIDAITGQRVEIESDLARSNGTEEKRRKQSKAGLRVWKNPARKAANVAWSVREYGDPDAPDTWTPEQRRARQDKTDELRERYGDPDHPETWTPEQRAARAKAGEGQDAFWEQLKLTPRRWKDQVKRRTAHNQRADVKEKVSRGNLQSWAKRKAKEAAAQAELERLRKLVAGNGAEETARTPGRPKGMSERRMLEAQALERYKQEFIEKNGTDKGSIVYAAKKLYKVNSRRGVQQARQTLKLFRKWVQKPS